MSNRGARNIILVIIMVIAVFNLFAVKHHLYYFLQWHKVRWLDIPMHIVGGFWIGYTALAIIQWRLTRVLPLGQRIWYALAFAFGIGTLWEAFEYISDRTFAFEPYTYDMWDTLKDLFDDMIGGVTAGMLGSIHQHHQEHQSL